MTSTINEVKTIRRLVEEVESAFSSFMYQSSYETDLHDILKRALKKLYVLEDKLS